MPDLLQLQQLTDRLRHVGEVLEVAVLRSGSIALRTVTPAICIASEFRGLRVWAGDETGGGGEWEGLAE